MKKETNIYSTKSAFEIKEMDAGKREVAIYLSKFGVIDSDSDMIQKGAFAKSILERGPLADSNRKIAFLRSHDWEKPIGKFLSLQEDDFGLFAVAELGHSSYANDAWNDYMDGIIREHSIGFQYVSDKMRFMEDITAPNGVGFWNITEVKLYEGSAVLFGANEYTPTVDVMKSEDRKNYFETMSNEIDVLIKALANGKGTDERLYNIEMKLKFLNGQLLSLASVEPLNIKHSEASKPNPIETPFDWNRVINTIKK
jgi:HK97 family phage prohead protease